jgi:hypothetical protein
MLILEDVGDNPTVALYGNIPGNCFNWATGIASPGGQLCIALAEIAAATPVNPRAAVFTALLHHFPAQIFSHIHQAEAQNPETGPWYMCVFMIADNVQAGEGGREVHFARLCQDGFFGRPAANVGSLTRCQYNEPLDRWYSHNPHSDLLTEYTHGYYMFFVKTPVVEKKAKAPVKRAGSKFDPSKINPAFFKKTVAE